MIQWKSMCANHCGDRMCVSVHRVGVLSCSFHSFVIYCCCWRGLRPRTNLWNAWLFCNVLLLLVRPPLSKLKLNHISGASHLGVWAWCAGMSGYLVKFVSSLPALAEFSHTRPGAASMEWSLGSHRRSLNGDLWRTIIVAALSRGLTWRESGTMCI